jgi:MFS family permease
MIDAHVEVRGSRWATASLAFPMLMASLDTSIANVALPALRESFGVTFPQVQWVVVAYLLSLTSMIVGIGRLGDALGRRRLLLGGLTLFCTTSAFASFAPSLALLIMARAVQGLSAATVISMTMALAAEVVPPARIGRTMGLLGTMSALGTSLGPSLGGWLIEAFGWRAIFLVNVPLGLLAIWLARRLSVVDAPSPAAIRQFDVTGGGLLIAILGSYALAIISGNLWLLVATAFAVILFVRWEGRVAAPLVPLSLLGDARLSAGLMTNALVATVVMTTLVIGPFYLGGALGLAPSSFGLVMAAGPLAAALAGFPAGRIVDRVGSARVSVVSLGVMTIGLIALAQAPGVLGYIGAITAVTVSYAAFQAANNSSIMAGAGSSERGLISGLLNLSRNLGLISGAAAMGALFAASAGQVAEPLTTSAAARLCFEVAALLTLFALAISAASTFARRRAKLASVSVPESPVASRSAEA